MSSLIESLVAAIAHLPEAFQRAHERLFVQEHLTRLANRLEHFHRDGVPTERPLPHFAAEITPPLDEAFQPFAPVLAEPTPATLARALVAADTARLLILLGMRLTPASSTSPDGIPPTTAQLRAACEQVHSAANPLTVAGRAWSKHVHRSPEAFWGECTGSTAEKNAGARALVERILIATTWWNVFGHFQHEFVYEARVPSGHGARWGRGGDVFIGFLEPFDETQCPSLTESRE